MLAKGLNPYVEFRKAEFQAADEAKEAAMRAAVERNKAILAEKLIKEEDIQRKEEAIARKNKVRHTTNIVLELFIIFRRTKNAHEMNLALISSRHETETTSCLSHPIIVKSWTLLELRPGLIPQKSQTSPTFPLAWENRPGYHLKT